ncbi:hypothetical protein Metfor_1408 [Methanoregula formicica SMSP]|uniref:Glycosyltransferase RgtA/B/C/D-like domain-containing protein n=2 Tax=Methanoregula formicica TaxID=882104 RepID=L0HEI9_METFS|nr:hypothetical protein Metfor_1408 [Methanoregula formicica SMSP]
MVFPIQHTTFSQLNSRMIQIISSCHNKERMSKILLTIGYSLTINNFLVFFFCVPQGYIVDIYSALPLSFFLSLIVCYIIGSTAIFCSQGIYRKLGILLLFFNYSAVLIIPYMLGYYSMGRADDMTYIGEYLQISTSGSISGWDIYPASHIIGAALSIVTGLDPHIISFVIPLVCSFLFAGGLFLCCCLFLEDQILINIAIPASFIFYLGPYNFLNVPHGLFFAIIPLILYLVFKFIKHQNFINTVLVFPFILLVPFMHPFIVFLVVSTFLALIIFSQILKKVENLNYLRILHLFLMVVIGFLSWFIFCSTLMGDFYQSYRSYLQRVTEPVFFETTDKLTRINMNPDKLFKLLTVYYGRYTIPLLIIIIAIIIIYLKRDRITLVLKNYIAFWAFFYLFFLMLELILFFNPIISHQSDRLTNLNFIIYAQVPLFVVSLYVISMRFKSPLVKIFLFLLILSGIWSLSLFGTFNSPNIFKTNDALTNNEVHGMKWFFGTKITEKVLTPLSSIRRFQDLLSDKNYDSMVMVPDHFGYSDNTQSFTEINLKRGEQSYVVLLTIDELMYQKIPGYIEVGRYTENDYSRFRNDQSINAKIYHSLNIQIFDIY